MERIDASVINKAVNLRARLTGNFPGSPVELDFKFTIAADRHGSMNQAVDLVARGS